MLKLGVGLVLVGYFPGLGWCELWTACVPSRVFTNEGKGNDPGFPIKNVGNDLSADGIPFSSLGVQAARLHEGSV